MEGLLSHSYLMKPVHHYRHSGLHVASEIGLPEWDAFACGPAKADVRIVLSDLPCPDCPCDGSVAGGEVMRFAVEGIGGWQVERGRVIRLHPGLTAGPAELRLFTLGSAWGAIGYQRGFAMWHGSAVERSGRTVLFCGNQGAGKSTMAAMLCKDGARLVADDLSRIEPTGGGRGGVGGRRAGPVIHPSSTRIKLWREAAGQTGWQDRILQRDYMREDKFHCAAPDHHGGAAPLPLIGVVVLVEGKEYRLERLFGSTALEAVLKATLYRPEMVEALSAWGRQGALVAQVLERTPAWRLTRAKDFAEPDLSAIWQAAG